MQGPRINGGINGRIHKKEGRRGFTVDGLRVELVKSLKMSQTFAPRLLNFKECSLILPPLALPSVGGPVIDIYNRYMSVS